MRREASARYSLSPAKPPNCLWRREVTPRPGPTQEGRLDFASTSFESRHLQRVDGHAGPLLDLDGGVGRGRGALLVDGGNADGDDQTARHDTVVPRVHGDDDGCCRAHGLAW